MLQRGRQQLGSARLATEADLQVARSGLQKGRASQLLDVLQRLRSVGRLGHDIRHASGPCLCVSVPCSVF